MSNGAITAPDPDGFLRQLPNALPGWFLIVATMVVIRLGAEPRMTSAVVSDQKGWVIDVTHLNYILLGSILGGVHRNILFGGRRPV